MPYIIDGNNVIGCSPDISLDDPDSREKLISLVRKFQESKHAKVTLVFDGSPGGNGLYHNVITPKFSVLFPTLGNSADDEIKKLLAHSHHSPELVLVTSDRELKKLAKDKGVRTRNSIEFYFEMKKICFQQGKKEESQKRIEKSLSPTEVENWLKIFSKNE